jgi:hypothetical protein
VTPWDFRRIDPQESALVIVCTKYSKLARNLGTHSPEVEFLDEIQTIVLRVFLLAIHSYLYSFALRFLFLQTQALAISRVQLLYTIKDKE